MKRKKWSEIEERTLLTKYSDLQTTGILAKLKTREKKFKPIAEHVNSVHHLRDPISFPFKWSWRDVSIKVQNMRHQYLGVKQKIRVSDCEYNWEDGENHWENFDKYKDVFGDIEIIECNKRGLNDNDNGNDNVVFGDEFFEFDELENGGDDDDGDVGIDEEGTSGGGGGGGDDEDSGFVHVKKSTKGLVGAQVLELRDVVMRREEKRREREWRREEGVFETEERSLDDGCGCGSVLGRDREMAWAKREMESRVRLEMEFDEERRRRRKVEERWEEEEMKWREKMVSMQIEHEKQVMELHVNACQNQMQVLGVMARFFCQFFGSVNDGLGNLAPQVLQHPISGGLDDNGKVDANSPSAFL